MFGKLSLKRLITFIGDSFLSLGSRRRLQSLMPMKSEAIVRGGLMRAVRGLSSPVDKPHHTRALQTADDPLFVLELNELISLSFDFDFGGASKDLLLGFQFHFDSGDTVSQS